MRKILITVSVVILLLGIWFLVFKGEDPFAVQRSIKAIKSGRGYEVMEEEKKYMTKAGSHANLMQFLEGHYGLEFYEMYEDKTLFFKGGEIVAYETKRIFKDYIIWEIID